MTRGSRIGGASVAGGVQPAACVFSTSAAVGQARRATRTPQPERGEGVDGVRVARDDEPRAASRAHAARCTSLEVEPIDLAVDLDRDAALPPRRRHASMSNGERLALQQQAAGRVAEDVDPRVLDARAAAGRSSAAGSWLKPEWTEAMTMSSWARQSSARSIVPSARMSHSMPASSVMPSSRPLSARIARGVRERALLVEAVGHRQRLAVIGDGDVLEARRRCAAAPSSRCRPAVGRRSCACAGRRAGRDRSIRRGSAPRSARRRSRRGSRAARAGSTRGRAPRRCLPRCSPATDVVRRRGTGRTRSACKPRPDRAVAQRDVVRLRAGEVLQRGAAALGWHQAQIGLEAAAQQHARLGVAVRRARARPSGWPMNAVHQRRRRRPTARMSRSPQVSQPRRRLPTGMISASGARSRRRSTSAAAVVVRVRQQVPAGVAACAPRAP